MRKRLTVLPVPALILAIGVSAILDVRGIYEPEWLLPILNLLFLFLPGCLIAYVSVQGYLLSGSFPLLLFGSAAMMYGTSSGIAGWMIGVLGAVDAGTVLHHTGAAIGVILNVWSGLLVAGVSAASCPASRRAKTILLYGGLAGTILGLSWASLHGLTPTFVVPEGGFTPIRGVTLGVAIAGFVVSALLFWKRYLERQSEFLYWGTLALAMLSIGLAGLFLQRGVGTLVGWCSRSAQYVGSVYFLIAVVRAWRAAQGRNVPVARMIASLFREAEANYRVLVETATDAIVAFDSGGRVLFWNTAAERLFGYMRDETVGAPFGEVTGLRAEIERWTAGEVPSANSERVLPLASAVQSQATRRDGTTFPVEYSVSVRPIAEGLIGTVILRDITERKRGEESLKRLNRDLRMISLCNQVLVRAADEAGLLREICQTIAEAGKHRVAWVGFVGDGEERYVRPVAVVGCEPERVDRHAMDLADPAWATCPVAVALHTGTPQVVQDIPGNPPRCPWHDEAVHLGIGSSVSLPLKEGERTFGVLTIYSASLDAFDAEEANLLRELADDLAYGIQAFRTRTAHERALAEIERLARFPSENPNPILRVASDGTILYANAPSGPLLRLWGTAVGDRMPEEWRRRIGHVLEQPAPESIDVSCAECMYSIDIAPVPEAGYVNLYGRDITERMRAAAAREKSERTVRVIFDTATDGILLADAMTRRFVKANPAMCRMLGYSQEEVERLSVADIHPADRLEQVASEFEKMLGGAAGMAFDIPVKRKDGSVFRADIVSSSFELDGHPYLLGVFRDITNRKRLEEERLHLEVQLRQQQKLEAIGTLASGVAHEINNPIAGIMNYAQLIADTAEPASQTAEYAKEIGQETERVATIVRNLLQFARQEKQSHSLARPADLVEQTLSLVRAVLRHDQVTLTVAVPEALPPIKCRSQQLQQVLMNLLTNARDALNAKYPGYHADKTITVRAQLLDHDGRRWLRLTVADQGPGIPPEIQPRIFDPFFTTKPRDKGTGLGLSISHGIVKDHHGVLHFETEPGIGTQFHLDLPVDNGWTLEGQ